MLRRGLRQQRDQFERRRAQRPGAEQHRPRLRDLGQDLAAFSDPYSRDISVSPGTSFRGKTTRRRHFAPGRLRPRRGQADLDHRLSRLQGLAGRRLRLWHGRHPLSPADGSSFRRFRPSARNCALQGVAVRRQARLAGRRLLRQRGPAARGHAALRQRLWPLRHLPPDHGQPARWRLQPDLARLHRPARASDRLGRVRPGRPDDPRRDRPPRRASTTAAATGDVYDRTAATSRCSRTTSSTSPTSSMSRSGCATPASARSSTRRSPTTIWRASRTRPRSPPFLTNAALARDRRRDHRAQLPGQQHRRTQRRQHQRQAQGKPPHRHRRAVVQAE